MLPQSRVIVCESDPVPPVSLLEVPILDPVVAGHIRTVGRPHEPTVLKFSADILVSPYRGCRLNEGDERVQPRASRRDPSEPFLRSARAKGFRVVVVQQVRGTPVFREHLLQSTIMVDENDVAR